MDYEISIPTKILRSREIQAQDKFVYGAIRWIHGKTGQCVTTNAVLAKMVGGVARSVQNSLRRLERMGYIKKTYIGHWREGKRILAPVEVERMPIELVCYYCGMPNPGGENLHQDHFQPKSKGGKNGDDNIVLCCRKCNSKKHDKNGDDFMGGMKDVLSPTDGHVPLFRRSRTTL